jgi:hypothetical protein
MGRYGWVHVARGAVELNGQTLADGDGASLSRDGTATLRGLRAAELRLFDLP